MSRTCKESVRSRSIVKNHGDLERRVDRQGETLIWCRKVLGICKAENGTQIC